MRYEHYSKNTLNPVYWC